MSKNTTTELENTKKEHKTISKNQLRKLGYSIAQLEANLLLMLPLEITYEDWCFLHMVADSDIND